jgi:quinol-cytochrome oxidoreductase complex cytochrome b subunit
MSVRATYLRLRTRAAHVWGVLVLSVFTAFLLILAWVDRRCS